MICFSLILGINYEETLNKIICYYEKKIVIWNNDIRNKYFNSINVNRAYSEDLFWVIIMEKYRRKK